MKNSKISIFFFTCSLFVFMSIVSIVLADDVKVNALNQDYKRSALNLKKQTSNIKWVNIFAQKKEQGLSTNAPEIHASDALEREMIKKGELIPVLKLSKRQAK